MLKYTKLNKLNCILLENRYYFGFRKKMAKRKIDCSIDDFIVDYLKKRKYKKSLQLFGEKNNSFMGRKLENHDVCKKFIKYLKIKESEKGDVDDDLGFEINFGAYQPESRLQITNFIGKKNNSRNKTDDKKEKIEIPKKFIKKIKNLGLREKDADILYKSKIDWTAVYLGRISNCCRLNNKNSRPVISRRLEYRNLKSCFREQDLLH